MLIAMAVCPSDLIRCLFTIYVYNNHIMSTNAGLNLVDTLAAEGRTSMSAFEVRERLGLSAQSASNLLARLSRDGLIERVRRGEYLLRPLGELCVSATASDRLAQAIAIAVGGASHRICYRTALHEHGLLSRPGRRVQVAVARRLYVDQLGDRSLESIIERPAFIHVGAEQHQQAWISTIERALLESAETPRRVGGISTVAEALAVATLAPDRLVELGERLAFAPGLRRLVSLDRHLRLGKLSEVVLSPRHGRLLPLDPADTRTDGFIDHALGVRWPGPTEELLEVANQ
jgi:predicted transcriptional regulator of viral defense system